MPKFTTLAVASVPGWLAGVILVYGVASCAALDLSRAVVVAPADLSSREAKAVDMLVDEVHKRTQIQLNVITAWPGNGRPAIAVGPAASTKKFAGKFAAELQKEPPGKAEGFRIRGDASGVVVVGNDERGVLFGIGYLLRQLQMSRGKIQLADNIDVATAPHYLLRGHQLGYRPKTNSYDAWDLARWEQYYRDLAVFGANCIELIPPRSDDAATSPDFPLPKFEAISVGRVVAARRN